MIEQRAERSKDGAARARGFMTLNQVEQVVMLSGGTVQHLGRRPNRFYAGSTLGNALLGVAAASLKSAWAMSIREKKELYGKARLVTSQDKGASAPERSDDVIEVFNFDLMTHQLWQEIYYRAQACAVIHLTAAEETAALVAMHQGIQYCGCTFTAAHTQHLTRHLQVQIFKSFLTNGSPFFKPDLASVLNWGVAADAANSVSTPSKSQQVRPVFPSQVEARANIKFKASQP